MRNHSVDTSFIAHGVVTPERYAQAKIHFIRRFAVSLDKDIQSGSKLSCWNQRPLHRILSCS